MREKPARLNAVRNLRHAIINSERGLRVAKLDKALQTPEA